MRRLFIGLTAGVLGIVGLTATPSIASARESHGRSHGRVEHREYGHRFKGGYYYHRHDCPVWSRRVWNGRCSRWEYLDPGLNVYYYYYAPGDCYYPITYCP